MSLDKNKTDMIALISTALTERGCHIIQSPGDGDVDIVNVLIERSSCGTTTAGKDTGLLILLLHYSRRQCGIIYFRSDANKQAKEHSVHY